MALNFKSSKYIKNDQELFAWIKDLEKPVSFNGQYHFLPQAERIMTDESRLKFIWNKTDAWQTITLTLDKKFVASNWLNADGGLILKNSGSVVSYQLPPYGTVIFYASAGKDNSNKPVKSVAVVSDKSKEILSLNNWDFKSDSIEMNKTPLFDWKGNDQLKFSSAQGIYKSSFLWKEPKSGAHYWLDLGKVYFTADVFINGKFAGTRIFAPYMLNITSFLKSGENNIEIRITPGQLNGYIGKAKQGDVYYKQFKNKDDQIMSAGLIGPVKIRKSSEVKFNN